MVSASLVALFFFPEHEQHKQETKHVDTPTTTNESQRKPTKTNQTNDILQEPYILLIVLTTIKTKQSISPE